MTSIELHSESARTSPADSTSAARAAAAVLGMLFVGLALWPPAVHVAAAASLLPVAVAGHLLGRRAGLVSAAWCCLWTLTGWALYAHGATPFETTRILLLTLLAPCVGWATGQGHALRKQIARRRGERAHAEEQLAVAERQARTLLEALPDLFYRIDRAGKVLDFNQPPAQLEQPFDAPVVGRNISDALPARMAEQLMEAAHQALHSSEVITYEFTGPANRSTARDYEARVVRGGEHEVIALIRDVTSLKRLTRELNDAHHSAVQAASTKGRFLATMSHQIRTPMNGVIGMTNVLLQTRLKPDQHEYTSIIRNSGEALLSILDDVLDVSKLEAGQIQLDQAEFGLRASLDEVVELLASKAHARGLEVANLVDARVPEWVRGDRGRVRQVITNLLGNAIKFTQQGQVSLRVTVVGHDRDKAMIRFEVSDTGRGMSREEQKKLFQDFSQGDATIARDYGGTGLGLAISQQIVTAMGGHMAVQSEPGKGSAFSFTMRFETSPGRTTGSFLLPRALSGARLFAAPLHPLTRSVLKHELSPFGTHIEEAGTHADLAERVRAENLFDLVLLELPLLATDAEVRERVTAAAAAAGNLPLCVLHGIGRRAVADVAREAGAALCLAKPLRRTSLYEGLGKLLGISARKPKRNTRDSARRPPSRPLRARILVAEDNLVNQKVAVRTLEMLGCDTEVVENGALALEALGQSPFDLVLMDCQMPIMDGFEATRQIRAREVNGLHVPIVAMTANAMQGDRERCLEAGMDDYVPKPMTVPALEGALRRWLPQLLGYTPRSGTALLEGDGPGNA